MVRYGSLDSPEDSAPPEIPWQRPRQWLPLPDLDPDDEIFVGLAAIFPGAPTTLALGASGNFHVDWGDGSQQDVFSPSPLIERWAWSTYRSQQASELELPLFSTDLPWINRLPETIRARYGPQSITLPSSAYQLEVRADNRVVVLLDPPLWSDGIGSIFEVLWRYPTTLLVPTIVRHRYDHDNPLLAGTETSRGYRQAIVTVTPQPGQRLTALRLQDGYGDDETVSSWLDIAIASPILSELWIGKR